MAPLRSALFLARQLGLARPRVGLVDTTVTLGAVRRPADLYEPPGEVRATVLCVHGMSVVAHRDPRFVRLCTALASVGFRVVAPLFEDIAALRMRSGQIGDIEDAIASTAADPELAHDGTVSVLSVSFSAGLCLIAASRPGVRDRVRAVCAIGGYGDIQSTLEALLTAGNDVSPYARLIVLSNYLPLSTGPRPGVCEALRIAALDIWHARTEPELGAFLASLDQDDRKLATALVHDPAARVEHWCRIVASKGDFLDEFSVVDHVPRLAARATLIHGASDHVIPCGQSRAIARAIERGGARARLLVTPLLSHGDAQRPRTAVLHAPGLVAAFGGFFDDAVARA